MDLQEVLWVSVECCCSCGHADSPFRGVCGHSGGSNGLLRRSRGLMGSCRVLAGSRGPLEWYF